MGFQIRSQIDQLRLFLFFQITNRNIGLLFNDVLNGFFADDRSLLICDMLSLHFLVFRDLVTEVGCFFKVFFAGCLSFEVFSFNQALIDNFWIHKVQSQVHFRPGFIQQINGLVWQEAILDVAVWKNSRRFDGPVCIVNVVVVFVFFLDAFEDGDGFFNRWLIDLNGLHPTFQGRIFFNDAVFIEGSSTDQLEFTTRQGWFEDISSVHIAFASRSCANNFMDFVDEKNYIFTLTNFIH